MAEKTHWKKVVSDPKFLGEADFGEGEQKILTIASWQNGVEVVNAEGKSSKTILHWKENGVKPLILNSTNSKAVAKVAGSPYLDDWVGKRVLLEIKKVRAFGEYVNAVRISEKAPPAQKANAQIKCEETGCTKIIQPGFGMDAEQLAEYTKSKFGKRICADCATKRAEKLSKKEQSAE